MIRIYSIGKLGVGKSTITICGSRAYLKLDEPLLRTSTEQLFKSRNIYGGILPLKVKKEHYQKWFKEGNLYVFISDPQGSTDDECEKAYLNVAKDMLAKSGMVITKIEHMEAGKWVSEKL